MDKKRRKHLGDIKRSLYDPKAKTKVRGHSSFSLKRQTGSGSKKTKKWDHSDLEETKVKSVVRKRVSVAKGIFLVSLVFFLAAVAYSGFTFWRGINVVDADNIKLDLISKSFVDSGEEFTVDITVTNENPLPIDRATLLISSSSLSSAGEQATYNLGSLLPGQQIEQSHNLTIFGEEGSQKEVIAVLQYEVAGSSSSFEKTNVQLVSIRSAPLEILASVPEKVVNNQVNKMTVQVTSLASGPVSDVVLSANFPSGFSLLSATPEPLSGGSDWYIGELQPGESVEFEVEGSFEGQEGEMKSISFTVGSGTSNGDLVTPLNSSLSRLEIVFPFVYAEIYVGGKTDSVIGVAQNSRLSGEVYWVNNTAEKIKNIEIEMQLSGEGYNPELVSASSGLYRVTQDKIFWSKTTSPALANVNPGQSGSLNFSIKLDSGLVDNLLVSPEMRLETTVRSSSVSGEIRETKLVDSMRIRPRTQVGLTVATLYRNGPFTNTGPMPPRVDQTTSYTVRVKPTNTINEATEVVITMPIASRTEWLGANATVGTFQYDQFNRQVVWRIPRLEPGTGINKPAPELYAKIGYTPTLAEVGKAIPLTESLSMVAQDDFSGARLTTSRGGASSSLTGEVGTPGGDGRVVR